MSGLEAWLVSREPAPPEPLATALRAVARASAVASEAVGVGDAESGRADELAAAGWERLRLALARPGRERESAYRLLEADALFTYACEAALERGDPAAALRRVLTVASG